MELREFQVPKRRPKGEERGSKTQKSSILKQYDATEAPKLLQMAGKVDT